MAMGEFVKIYLLQRKIEIGIIYVLLSFNFLVGFFLRVKYILLCPEDIYFTMILQVQNWVTYPRKQYPIKQFQKWNCFTNVIMVLTQIIHQKWIYSSVLQNNTSIGMEYYLWEDVNLFKSSTTHSTNVYHNIFHQFQKAVKWSRYLPTVIKKFAN